MEPKNILVTGGCGFLGSHVVDELIKRKHCVTVFDNLSSCVLDDSGLEPLYVNEKARYFTDSYHYLENHFPMFHGFIHLARRHPMERSLSIMSTSWHGYLTTFMAMFVRMLERRAPLTRVVSAGIDPSYTDKEKDPLYMFDNQLSELYRFYHKPPMMGMYYLYFPNLKGERQLTFDNELFYIKHGHTIAVEDAASCICDFADGSRCHDIQSKLKVHIDNNDHHYGYALENYQ